MPRRRVSNARKELHGTLQPCRVRPVRLEALEVWPDPPRHFTGREKAAWVRLGEAAVASGAVTLADLPLAELAARAWARANAAMADAAAKATAVSAAVRLAADLLKSLQLSAVTRMTEPAAPDERSVTRRILDEVYAGEKTK